MNPPSVALAPARVLPTDVPIDVDADPARELARRELARSVYTDAGPSLIQRVTAWVGERIEDLLRAADAVGAGGVGGLLVLVAVVVLVVLVVRRGLGRTRRADARSAAVLDAVVRSADEHRRAAEQAVRDARFDEAVREGMRALVRGLEERAVLEPGPGRTAGEAAREIAAAMPAVRDAVAGAARVFDETVYGGRPADAAAARRVREADDEVQRTRTVVAP